MCSHCACALKSILTFQNIAHITLERHALTRGKVLRGHSVNVAEGRRNDGARCIRLVEDVAH